MDKRFPEGSIVYCNRYNEVDDKLPIGEYVIVMRQDKASDELGATCKRLEKHEACLMSACRNLRTAIAITRAFS